jgi:RNA-splicing ligase RtcB
LPKSSAEAAGVECRNDPGVVDEIPGAYEDIARVMAQQHDLVDAVAHVLPRLAYSDVSAGRRMSSRRDRVETA